MKERSSEVEAVLPLFGASMIRWGVYLKKEDEVDCLVGGTKFDSMLFIMRHSFMRKAGRLHAIKL